MAGATDEPSLSAYYRDYQDSGRSAAAFALGHPVRGLAALIATARLPRSHAPLSRGGEAEVIRRALLRPALLGAPAACTGLGVLEVPDDTTTYLQGRHKQTLRRKVRAAQQRGITWRLVDDPVERSHLVRLADRAERSHPDPRYRELEPDNTDLFRYGLWILASSADGTPLLLSVTPVDGEYGLLRYFRTFGWSDAHSLSRYLMCQALVDVLSERGVRHVVDPWHPGELPNGLRHFQRMVGFRIARVRVRRRPFSPVRPDPPTTP
ncbi:hypothetical protein [Kineococcus indalonis]|uniref:hypothetical protein n=1 Tax=Kineococcus indalonis TaxID=2696566 RepID=UPI001411CD87|nr:hypothetical protein [Kineococcus indalonis]